MKLEAANRRNPQSICVATIAAVVDNRLLIHFDDWDDTHDYWWEFDPRKLLLFKPITQFFPPIT